MSRVVVVSNRVGDLSAGSQSGGLTVAVGDALRESGGVWFGWNGEISQDSKLSQQTADGAPSVTLATFPLSEQDYEQYYLGYSNQVLWPACHYRLDLSHFERDFLEGYRRVNRKFASLLYPLLKPDDIVWVHDYHLIPLAAELRALGAKQLLGFFLHIPFPPVDVFFAVPHHEWLVRSLFCYDVVGVQTKSDLSNLQTYVRESGGSVSAQGRLSAYGGRVIAGAFPISIDVDAFTAMAESEEAQRRLERLQQHTFEQANIIGVDRLDYSKGLPDRFRMFERCLEMYPSNHRRVSLLQIAPPTREDVEAYAEIRRELEALSGAINGRFGDFDWTPVRYIHRNIPRDVLAVLLRGSKVGLVTPLRDGMNLVAKEYVAAQDPEDPGVLVLSKFAGAAEEMEQALLVNPYNLDACVDSLQRAISMTSDERIERHSALLARLKKHDAAHWRRSFLTALRRAQLGAVA